MMMVLDLRGAELIDGMTIDGIVVEVPVGSQGRTRAGLAAAVLFPVDLLLPFWPAGV